MREIEIKTTKHQEILDITEKIKNLIKNSGINKGICNIYARHATAAIIINEGDDPNVKTDLLNVLNKIVPKKGNYLHDRIDNNAQAHMLSSVLGCSVNVPFQNGVLLLGTYQAIMFVELDGPRTRTIVVSLIEDKE